VPLCRVAFFIVVLNVVTPFCLFVGDEEKKWLTSTAERLPEGDRPNVRLKCVRNATENASEAQKRQFFVLSAVD
jgi:hypothetical protein